MGIDTAIEYADQLLYERTGRHLSDLQSCIIQQSWQGQTYGQVATIAGYSEGHIKDVASQLWRLLSEALWASALRKEICDRASSTASSARLKKPLLSIKLNLLGQRLSKQSFLLPQQ